MLQKTVFRYARDVSQSSDYFGFSFGAGKELKGDAIDLVGTFHTCREALMGEMRRDINNENDRLPTDKMRILVRFSESRAQGKADRILIDGWVERATSVLQAFDKLAGWPLTRVHKVKTSARSIDIYYFHSSRRWMKSSYLVSLYLLLIRVCRDDRITGFKDFYSLVAVIDKIDRSTKKLVTDSGYISSSKPYWEAIMKGYSRLFRKRKMVYYWDKERLGSGNNGGSEGIQNLVTGATSYTEVRKELNEIKKEIDSKKKSK